MNLYQLMLESKPASSWDNIFLLEATLWSRRSHDVQTQCGCVLVKNKTNISSGYNGFIRDIDDDTLPKVRPAKYPFMIHAEANAVYNATRNGQSTLNSTAYITAVPCLQCLQMLYQCGVTKIYFSDISNPKIVSLSKDYEDILELMGDKIELRFIPKTSLDTEFLLEYVEKITKM